MIYSLLPHRLHGEVDSFGRQSFSNLRGLSGCSSVYVLYLIAISLNKWSKQNQLVRFSQISEYPDKLNKKELKLCHICSCCRTLLFRFIKFYSALMSLDVNECQYNKGGCEQRCKNRPGTYRCYCRHGYRKSRSDGRKCEGRYITLLSFVQRCQVMIQEVLTLRSSLF